MIGAKELIEEMREGEEYATAIMPIEILHKIDLELQEQMYFTIRQKSDKYKEDETYTNLVMDVYKAKKKLSEYEYKLNHE